MDQTMKKGICCGCFKVVKVDTLSTIGNKLYCIECIGRYII
jgi:hypothetical protein